MTTLLIKTQHGAGPVYSFDVTVVPRQGEHITFPVIDGDGSHYETKEVLVVDHHVENNAVIIITR